MIENLAQEKNQSGLSGEWTKLPEGKPATRGSKRQVFNGKKPKIVIIVDDLGSNKESVDRLLKIPASITFAVLPNLPYSRYAASMGNSNGRDVILHIPMEPMDSSEYVWSDSRDGTLLTGLPKSEILSKLDKDLASVPYIRV